MVVQCWIGDGGNEEIKPDLFFFGYQGVDESRWEAHKINLPLQRDVSKQY